MKAVIMCGGSGTRLWPISRTSTPKQFVPLFEGKSLFELTIERNIKLVSEFIIVVNAAQLSLCKSQIPEILKDKVKYIIEPMGRNTAPAITLAALLSKDSDLLILASDHLIEDLNRYHNCVIQAQDLSKKNSLVTFGITPSYPEVGFGYIEAQDNNVISFKEKPDISTAKEYISSGNYYWNSGMFLFNTTTYLTQLELYSKDILTKSKIALENAKIEETIYFIQENDMHNIPADSIDYAVMEKSSCVKVIPSNFGWSDLGSFDSLATHLPKDQDGNTQNPKHLYLNSKNNLIIGEKRLITTFDIENLIIVDTPDALLIGKRGESQRVKELLEQVKAFNADLLN